MAEHPSAALTYSTYLALDDLLGSQRPRSDEHDEMLFIVVHQVYELWFKQVLHEFAFLQQRLHAAETAHALATVRRVLTILKTVVAQIDVLETMTPRQFLSFRHRLAESSGFQSAQFRELEVVLGRRGEPALAHYAVDSRERRRIAAAMARPALFDSLLHYLAAMGYEIADDVLHRDVGVAWQGSDAVQETLLRVYRDDGEPAQLCERFVDLDEGLQEWRYRHVKMVERTIGDRHGTGGSTGVEYLRATLWRPAFPDLWAIRSRL